MHDRLSRARTLCSWRHDIILWRAAFNLCAILIPGVAAAQPTGALRGAVHDSLGGVVSNAHVEIAGSALAPRSGVTFLRRSHFFANLSR